MSRLEAVRQTAQPPRDPMLVALAEQAQRVGWEAEWQPPGFVAQWWLRLRNNDIGVDAFADDGGLSFYLQYSGLWSQPARTPTEALRAAYAALGVALDQAEESGLGRLETPAQDSDA